MLTGESNVELSLLTCVML